MMGPHSYEPNVFDKSHYAASLYQKFKRSLQLGPKYYLWDLPRYFRDRRALNLPLKDFRVLLNPLREICRGSDCKFPLPPGYQDALRRLQEAGIRLTMPRERLEALLGAWWSTRDVSGDVIECGSFRGATALLLALLAKLNRREPVTLMLDTFTGIPGTSKYDSSRSMGEFKPPENYVGEIWQKAASLGVLDRIEIHQGLFSETFAALSPRNLVFSFVHIDANIYDGTREACVFTAPRISPGGLTVFDDYNGVCDLGARLAIDHYFAAWKIKPVPLAGSSAYVKFKGGVA